MIKTINFDKNQLANKKINLYKNSNYHNKFKIKKNHSKNKILY